MSDYFISFPIRMAMRYLKSSMRDHSFSFMISSAIMSITISSFILTLIMGIMNGFLNVTERQLRGINPPITMRNPYKGYLQFDKIKNVMEKEFPQEILLCHANSIQQVILQKDRQSDISSVIMLQGIDPYNSSIITSDYFTNKLKSLPELLDGDTIIIGHELAQSLNLQENDIVNLMFLNEESIDTDAISLSHMKVKVSGIFSSGIDDIDSNLCICSLHTIEQCCPSWGVTHISITPTPDSSIIELLTRIKDRFGLPVYTWKELYPALVSALNLEYYVMIGIACLIMLIACMNIMSLLSLYITHKQKDVAILRISGASEKMIHAIFIIMGVTLASIGTIMGQLCATILGYCIDFFHLIPLPKVYYSSYLPIHIHSMHLLITIIVTMAITIIASFFATYRITRYSTADIVKQSV